MRYKYGLLFVVPHRVCPSPKSLGDKPNIIICGVAVILTVVYYASPSSLIFQWKFTKQDGHTEIQLAQY